MSADRKVDLHRAVAASEAAAALDKRGLSTLTALVGLLLQGKPSDPPDLTDLNLSLEVIGRNAFQPELAIDMLYSVALSSLTSLEKSRTGRQLLATGTSALELALKKSATIEGPTCALKSLLALLMLRAHEMASDSVDLDRAILLGEQARREETGPGAWIASISNVWHDLGVCFYKQFVIDRARRELLDITIDFLRRAEEVNSPTSRTAALLNDLSVVLIQRYETSGNIEDLDSAIRMAEEGLALATSSGYAQTENVHILASALWHRYVLRGKRADLDRGIALCASGDGRLSSDADLALANGLAIWLSERFFARGNVADIDQAIAIWSRAIECKELDFVKRNRYRRNVVVSLLARFRRCGRADDLERASLMLDLIPEQALPDTTGKADLLHLKSQILLQRKDGLTSLADLTRAIDLLRMAESYQPNTNTLTSIRIELANALRHVGASTHETSFLDEAIELQRAIISSSSSDTNDSVVKVRANLGFTLRARYNITWDAQDYRAAFETWDAAMKLAVDSIPEVAVIGGRDWGDWEFERRSWEAASRAYDYVREALEQVIRSQTNRVGSESWLRETQGVFARAAFSETKLGRPRRALDFLEFGSARLLAEQLQLQGRLLEKLKETGHVELYDGILDSTEQLRRLSAQSSVSASIDEVRPASDSLIQIRDARKDLKEKLDLVQRLPGFEDILATPSIDAILSALDGATLAYLAATSAGGLALIIGSETGTESMKAVLLPQLCEARVRTLAAKYRSAYAKWACDGTDPESYRDWAVQLDATTQQLWDMGIGEIMSCVAADRRVCLVPSGLLAMLPLHAAWFSEPGPMSRKQYALDKNVVTYAPNARALIAAQRIGKNDPMANVLAIADPASTVERRLIYSSLEAEAALVHSQRRLILQGPDATLHAIIGSLRDFTLIHFASHAYAELNEPLESALMLANEDRLTLRDVLHLRLQNTRLVVLSACETAIPGEKLADEIINLPMGFLYAGTSGVIGSLWSIPDISTSILMIRFYWLLSELSIDLPAALRSSQRWMRDANAAELLAFLSDTVNTASFSENQAGAWRRLIETLRSIPQERRPFADQTYWAAFSYVGV
ncbi:CHAT domain-containing protein [Paraburkholderia strydomiana]|uniref:CHAT domain-containing protein n=1 Tax=Paraburkholderia strydomiana TaxID=1245417 RepID=UPI0038B826CE